MGAQGITLKYDRVHTVLGERKFVLVVSEGAFGRKQTSFYDLFRVENVKIAEHWDTVETIPPPRAVEERQRQVWVFARKAPEAKNERALRRLQVADQALGQGGS
jgi:hypothetical protein